MLRSNAWHLLVQLLRNLDKATAIDLAKPLKVSQLASQLKKCTHGFLNLISVKGRDDIGNTAIAIVKEVQPAASFAELLVVEEIDIFEVSIQGKEEFCVRQVRGLGSAQRGH